LPNMCISNNR